MNTNIEENLVHKYLSDIDAEIDKLTEKWDSSCEVCYEYYCEYRHKGIESFTNRLGSTNTAFDTDTDTNKEALIDLLVKKYEIEHKNDKESKESEKDEKVYEDVDIEGLVKVFNKWLYIEDNTDITIPLAYVVSNFTKADPGCMAIIAPSGSYKTEFIRSVGTVTNEFVYPLDDFTSHTLITGMPKVRDVVPDLEGRLITVKDFTSVLSKRDDERAAIFSNIRDMADGYLNKQFGSGKRVSYQDIHSSFLIATTDVLENYYSLTGILGQRIIYFRPSNNGKKAMERARKNIDCGNEMREELHEAMMEVIDSAVRNKQRLDNYQAGLTEGNNDMLLEYTNIVAIARTHVERDYKGRVTKTPTPEFPTRLIREIVKIIGCHAVLHNREVGEEDLQVGLKVLSDNIPPDRLSILRELAKEPIAGFFTEEITSALSLASHATRQRLEELLVLKIIYKEVVEGRRSDKWRIVPEYRGVLQGFLSGNTEKHRGEDLHRCIYEGKEISLTYSIYPYEYIKEVLISKTKKFKKDEIDTTRKCYIYTVSDSPPYVLCAKCNEKKPYMSLYGKTLYCDNCLEAILEDEEAKVILKGKELQKEQKTLEAKTQQESPENVCSACGRDTATTLYKGEWLCKECRNDYGEFGEDKPANIDPKAFNEKLQNQQALEAKQRMELELTPFTQNDND